MKSFTKIIPFLSILPLVSCVSSYQLADLPNQKVTIENQDKARIYVVRPSIIGTVNKIKVYDNDQLIGSTLGHGCLSWERSPGNMSIKSVAENNAELTLFVKKGKVYYIKQNIRPGLLSARNSLQQLTPEAGKKQIANCKFS